MIDLQEWRTIRRFFLLKSGLFEYVLCVFFLSASQFHNFSYHNSLKYCTNSCICVFGMTPKLCQTRFLHFHLTCIFIDTFLPIICTDTKPLSFQIYLFWTLRTTFSSVCVHVLGKNSALHCSLIALL